jgi:putative spermidine/putrescine transport system substrate-binding protein
MPSSSVKEEKMTKPITRRDFVAAASVAGALLGAPAIVPAQETVLRITSWGGKWGEIMKGEVIPAFEKEMKCKVEIDSAFPYLPKLLASPRSKPLYDVLHANSDQQWQAAEADLVEPKFDAKKVPNIVDVYPYAVSDKIVGVSIFTSAIGLAYRTDKIAEAPTSWKDLWDRKYDGVRGAYVIPANSLGQSLFMISGQLYGGGMKDVDAAMKAMERLKPVKLVDFTGTMEKQLLAGEVHIAVLHDSGVLRYFDQNVPLAFVAPKEGVLSLEQVLTVTKGSDKKALGYAYVDYMLRPDVQQKLAEGVWYSPSNKKVKLAPKYQDRLYATEEKVKQLIQPDWQWYNARKDEFDDKFNRLFRS